MKVITIGRSSSNNVIINDPKVSRHHLQIIQHDDGHYSLSDFGSSNGTFINGQRIGGEVRLSPNDIVTIGDTNLPWNTYFSRVYTQVTPGGQSTVADPTPAPQPVNVSPAPVKSDSSYSIWTFLLGLASIILVAIIIVNYFTSPSVKLISAFGGGSAIEYFPLYLHGTAFTSGQWIMIVIALVLGGAADAVDGLLDVNSEDNSLSKAGLWLANIGVSLSLLFLILAIAAPYMYK